MLAAAHRGGNGNIIFAAIFAQEHGKDDQKSRKSCHVLSKRELFKLHPQRLRQHPDQAHGIKSPVTRAGHIGYQIQARQVCEFAGPIVSLPGGFIRFHPLVQPICEVPILNRQFRKRGWQSAGKSVVESKELLINQIIGDKIRDDVMESNHHCMIIFRDAEKNDSNQRTIHEVKRTARVGCNQSLKTVVPVFNRKLRNFHPFDRELKLRGNYRPGLAVNFRHRCTEILMAAHHLIDGSLQRSNIQLAFQPVGMAMVEVMDIRVYLLLHPQVFLLNSDGIVQSGTTLEDGFGRVAWSVTPQPLLKHFALGRCEPGNPLLMIAWLFAVNFIAHVFRNLPFSRDCRQRAKRRLTVTLEYLRLLEKTTHEFEPF